MKSNIFMFALGAAVGSLVTWKLVEKKYKDLADEEIASMEEYYNNKLMGDEEFRDADFEEIDEELQGLTPEECEDIGKSILEGINEGLNYTATAGLAAIEEDTEGIFETQANIREYIKPYVITPEEFGEYGNETKLLTYYSDFVLADEEGEIIIDPEAVVGDALEHFGEYEDDAVHVRDENIECDYEIIKVEQSFSELNGEEV